MKTIKIYLSMMSLLVLTACGGESGEAKRLGFASVDEMKEIQSRGWHTKDRYEMDRDKVGANNQGYVLSQNKQERAVQYMSACYATTSWVMTQPSHSYLNNSDSTGEQFLWFYRSSGEKYVGKEKFDSYVEDYNKKVMPYISKGNKVEVFEECTVNVVKSLPMLR